MTDYPELEKIQAVREESQKIGEFLEWLSGEGLQIAEYAEDEDEDGDDPRLTLHYESRESLLAKFFGIDLQKAEQERRAILEELQKK